MKFLQLLSFFGFDLETASPEQRLDSPWYSRLGNNGSGQTAPKVVAGVASLVALLIGIAGFVVGQRQVTAGKVNRALLVQQAGERARQIAATTGQLKGTIEEEKIRAAGTIQADARVKASTIENTLGIKTREAIYDPFIEQEEERKRVELALADPDRTTLQKDLIRQNFERKVKYFQALMAHFDKTITAPAQ